MVTSEHAKGFVGWLRSQPGANATKNEKVAILKKLFGVMGGVVENPFACAEIKKLPRRQVARNIYTPEQIETLFSAEGWLYQLFVAALCTFQREGDCCLIKRSYIDMEHNHIRFPYTAKTGVAIDLPMLPRFRQLALDQLAIPTSSEYLFPELADQYLRNPVYISGQVKKFLAEHGFEDTTIEVTGYARKVSVLDVHSLRHTAAAMAVLHGWPLSMVMKATGHKTVNMVMRYANHITEQQKEQYFTTFGGAVERQDGMDIRKKLAEMAYTLPIEEVRRILGGCRAELPYREGEVQTLSLTT